MTTPGIRKINIGEVYYFNFTNKEGTKFEMQALSAKGKPLDIVGVLPDRGWVSLMKCMAKTMWKVYLYRLAELRTFEAVMEDGGTVSIIDLVSDTIGGNRG